MVTPKRPNLTSSLSDPVPQLFSSFTTLKMIDTRLKLIVIPPCVSEEIQTSHQKTKGCNGRSLFRSVNKERKVPGCRRETWIVSE